MSWKGNTPTSTCVLWLQSRLALVWL
jgi:hypothetical protein